MIDAKTLQKYLNLAGNYNLVADGVFGPKSFSAARDLLTDLRCPGTWPDARTYVAIEQLFLNSAIGTSLLVDGVDGPKTAAARLIYTNSDLTPQPKVWPRQSSVPTYFGAITTANQTRVEVPFTMYADYQRLTSQIVETIQCHKLVAANLERILKRTVAHYGAVQLRKLNLDIFSGSRVVRIITGGVGYSMHSWGIAFDFDAANNEFDQQSWEGAAFSKAIYAPWLQFWYDEGAINLGKERNYDWMHFQFARL